MSDGDESLGSEFSDSFDVLSEESSFFADWEETPRRFRFPPASALRLPAGGELAPGTSSSALPAFFGETVETHGDLARLRQLAMNRERERAQKEKVLVGYVLANATARVGAGAGTRDGHRDTHVRWSAAPHVDQIFQCAQVIHQMDPVCFPEIAALDHYALSAFLALPGSLARIDMNVNLFKGEASDPSGVALALALEELGGYAREYSRHVDLATRFLVLARRTIRRGVTESADVRRGDWTIWELLAIVEDGKLSSRAKLPWIFDRKCRQQARTVHRLHPADRRRLEELRESWIREGLAGMRLGDAANSCGEVYRFLQATIQGESPRPEVSRDATRKAQARDADARPTTTTGAVRRYKSSPPALRPPAIARNVRRPPPSPPERSAESPRHAPAPALASLGERLATPQPTMDHPSGAVPRPSTPEEAEEIRDTPSGDMDALITPWESLEVLLQDHAQHTRRYRGLFEPPRQYSITVPRHRASQRRRKLSNPVPMKGSLMSTTRRA